MSETTTGDQRLVAGRYRLRSVLGTGSMGTVWAAYDEFLHRSVAVKELRVPPGVPPSRTEELRERTMREARAIAVLSHPNVIILHDVVRENDDPYVVMELMPARSLAEMLQRRGKLTVAQAAAMAESVAGALEAAHAAGITHRDVKPGNVLLASDGQIKLTDFGIARNISETTMTHTGMMLGSPAYVAPEVASGDSVTYSADLWGLGATLFAAIEGKPPYDVDGDPIKTVNEVVNGTVPQPAPGPLSPLVMGLMRKEPAERMSLAEVRGRLHPLLATPRHTLFEPSLFSEVGKTGSGSAAPDAGATVIIPQLPPPDRKPAQTPVAAPGAGELAPDPGPLPFTQSVQPEPTTRTGRTPARTAVLAVVAGLLFLLAAAGGFALTRLLADQPLTPPEQVTPAAASPRAKEQKLVTRHGDATNLQGAQGGLFTLRVPEGWSRFVTQRPEDALPTSTVVQFVSEDGTQQASVERFVDYFPYHTIDGYVSTLGAERAPGDFTLVTAEELEPSTNRDGRLLTYRTADSAEGGPAINRTTFAEAFRDGTSLWVVSVTVPTDQEKHGRTRLFDRIAPTFQQAR